MIVDLTNTPLVFIDCETTGLDPRNCRMIEVAAIRCINGEEVARFTSFIKIDREIPPFITKLTGITAEDLKDAPEFRDIVDQLDEILKDGLFVAHNAVFDYGFFKSEYIRAGRSFAAQRLCTKDLAKALYPRLPNHKLQTLIDHMQFEAQERHRAYDDAAVLIQFLRKCQDEFDEQRLRSACKVVA